LNDTSIRKAKPLGKEFILAEVIVQTSHNYMGKLKEIHDIVVGSTLEMTVIKKVKNMKYSS
jgi:hypothetical protein